VRSASTRSRASVEGHDNDPRMQLALDAAGMGTFVWHVQENCSEADARMLALLGLPSNEPANFDVLLTSVIHPDDRQQFANAIRAACNPQGTGVVREDVRVLLNDGTQRWLAITGEIQFEGHPPVARRMAGAAVDISARKNLEAALRENTTRVQTIITQALTGVVEADAVGRMTLVNRRWCEMLGYDESELIGMNIAAVTHPDSLESTLAAVRKLASGGPNFEIEKKYQRKDGSTLIATSNVSALRGSHGEYRGLIAVIVDITSRKQAEEALRRSEERFRQFGDASSDVLWLRKADDLQSEYLGGAVESIYGVRREVMLNDDKGRRWFNLILADDRQGVLDNLDRVRHGEKVSFEFRIRRRNDGAIRWIRNTDFPVFDGERVIRIGGIAQDVTEEKHTSGRLQVLVEELQHRTRNLVAVVRAVSNKTIEESSSLGDFKRRYNDRLGAVARTQGLLSRLDEGERITFDELLHAELSAHDKLDTYKSRLVLEGPAGVRLRSSALQTFALALHELTTNAIKYGALSGAEGHLLISWAVQVDANGQERLHVEWRESGVKVEEPSQRQGGGYGRELIERALPYQLQAQTTYVLGPEGVHCTITVPLSSTSDRQK
ncbi:MAG TPA: PAS domain S-box protein, partial [Steroidobacteraceae bacterium]|nr:PAS domain S-box protein [Steroidobacteraceae bacterium]